MSCSKRGDGSIRWSLEADDWRTHRRRAGWLEGFTGQIVSKIIAEAGRYDSYDYIEGNRTIYRHASALRAGHVHEAYDEERLRHKAALFARDCRTLRDLPGRECFARAQRIEPPVARGGQTEGAFHRLGCERWWRRALRREWTRRSEQALRELGMVHRAGGAYLSDPAARHWRARQALAREFLKRHSLENEVREQLELLPVVDRSIANPAIRRAELMTRARGFEQIAGWRKDAALFVTLTCPSAFHARHMSGEPNAHYEGKSVRDGQAWLCRQWARARAKFKRLSIEFYGFRVAEPHHDGTPHWHLLVFCRPKALETVKKVLRGYWLAEYAEEPGAQEHRCSFKPIDAAAGTAAGYLAKYVAKNIDGTGAVDTEGDDESGLAASSAALRVRAWASLHGIRQFQQVGGPPVGLYREFRRLRDEVADLDLERARRAADDGEWGNFIQAVGGISVGRRTTQQVEREITGELNAYLELRAAEPIGVRCASAFERTRTHVWRVVPLWATQSVTSLQASSATHSAPSLPSPASVAAWRLKSGSERPKTPGARVRCASSPREGLAAVYRRWINQNPPKRQVSDFFGIFPDLSALGPVAITVRHCTCEQCQPRKMTKRGVSESDWPAIAAAYQRFAALPKEAENPWLKGKPPPERVRAPTLSSHNASPEEFARVIAWHQAVAAQIPPYPRPKRQSDEERLRMSPREERFLAEVLAQSRKAAA